MNKIYILIALINLQACSDSNDTVSKTPLTLKEEAVLSIKSEGNPISGNGNLAIPNEQLSLLKEKAWLGDANAAAKLSDHYLFFLGDIETGIYWLQIGAENGDSIAMKNYSKLLLKLYDDKSRAQFWQNKAKTANQINALESLPGNAQ